MPDSTMELLVDDSMDIVSIEVTGPIIASESPKLRSLISDVLDNQKKLAIDLSKCDYMDSSGLATLVEAVQLAEQDKMSFRMVGTLSDKVRHLFEITRLDELFETYHAETMDAARTELSS